jgi:hypothetical protein
MCLFFWELVHFLPCCQLWRATGRRSRLRPKFQISRIEIERRLKMDDKINLNLQNLSVIALGIQILNWVWSDVGLWLKIFPQVWISNRLAFRNLEKLVNFLTASLNQTQTLVFSDCEFRCSNQWTVISPVTWGFCLSSFNCMSTALCFKSSFQHFGNWRN